MRKRRDAKLRLIRAALQIHRGMHIIAACKLGADWALTFGNGEKGT